MINLLALIVCFFASVIGAICGIGGGVIIKPLLDSVGIFGCNCYQFFIWLHSTFYDNLFRIKK